MKSVNGKVITKPTSVFEKDNEGHDYCIHEDDLNLFIEMLESGNDDEYEKFDDLFGENMIGMSQNIFRQRFLK